MVFGLGPSELLVILIIVILIYGGKRIPEIGRSLGKSMREFKDAKNEYEKDDVVEKWVEKDDTLPDGNAGEAGGDVRQDKAVRNRASEVSGSKIMKEKINQIK